MGNTFGKKITITLFGESHGSYIGATVDNMPAGIKIDTDFINKELAKRRPSGLISTSRVENDNFEFISGVFNETTTGAPLTVLIKNENTNSNDYNKNYGIARPSHADYTAHIKYEGFEDYRGGGHFSGRITAALVLIGSIFKKILEEKDIFIGTHILELASIKDKTLNVSLKDYIEDNNIDINNLNENILLDYKNFCKHNVTELNKKDFPVLNDNIKNEMINKIIEARENHDSISAILETEIVGIHAGIGEPFFDSLESIISHAVFSIPGIKGITFGSSDRFDNQYGSLFNDNFRQINDNVVTLTNNNSGINGGISNGMPIIFKSYVKPTPSIYQKQRTIDFINHKNTELEIEGRHDPCIAHRIRTVIDNLMAFVIYGEIYG